MLKTGSNYIVIVLLVLIIAIQAGSLFNQAANGNCQAALAFADDLIESRNSSTSALIEEFEAASNTGLSTEKVVAKIVDLQITTLEIISQQNSALLNVLGNCQ